MKSLSKILTTLIVCTFFSIIISIPSYLLLMAGTATCAMSLGCFGTSDAIFNTLMILCLFAPFLVFPIGAFTLRDKIYSSNPSSLRRQLLLGFVAGFPFFLFLGFVTFSSIWRKSTAYHPHEGINTQYYSTGQVSAIFGYRNGLLDGEFTSYCRNGAVESHSFFKVGEVIGRTEKQSCDGRSKIIQIFSEQGKLTYYAHYSEGKLQYEEKGEDSNTVVSEYDGNGILVLIKIGNREVYSRWYSDPLIFANQCDHSITC